MLFFCAAKLSAVAASESKSIAARIVDAVAVAVNERITTVLSLAAPASLAFIVLACRIFPVVDTVVVVVHKGGISFFSLGVGNGLLLRGGVLLFGTGNRLRMHRRRHGEGEEQSEGEDDQGFHGSVSEMSGGGQSDRRPRGS